MLRYFRFYVNQLTGLRTREWALFFRLFNHILLMLCLIILLRSVNNGLLLSTYSPTVYPWFFMAEALLSFSLSVAYARWTKPHWSMTQQQAVVLALFTCTIAFGRFAMFMDMTWINFALPVVCDAISGILLLQSWGLFSNLVDGRQAKRFFPLLGLGGTTGSIVGGWLSAQVTPLVGTENVLYLALILLAGIALTLWRIRTVPVVQSNQKALDLPELAPAGSTFQRRLKDTLIPLFKHPLLLYVLGILLTVRITSTLMDYQMQLQVKALADQDAMTSYMGRFFAFTSMFTLGVQLLFESRFIQRYGLVWGLASTPISLVGGTLLYIVHPTLFTISALKFSELLTRYSTFKTATELAYIPFEPRLRSNLRILTNGLLSVGTVPMISLAILIFADQRSVLIGLSLGFACLGVYLSLLVARPYREKLQGALDQKRLGGHVYKAPSHSFSPEGLQHFFDTARSVKVVFFLEHVLHERIELPIFPWKKLLHSESPQIRELTWRLLYHSPTPEVLVAMPELLKAETESRVQEAAIKALRRVGSDELNPFILALLPDAALRVQVECLVYLFDCGGIEGILEGAEYLKQWVNHPEARQRSAAAYAMGEIGVRFFRKDYLSLFDDSDMNVKKACIRAARKAVPNTLLPLLVRQLASQELGALSVEALSSLSAEQLIPACRLQLPFLRQHTTGLPHLIELVSRYTSSQALDLLMELFLEPQFSVKYAVIQQLSRLRYEHELDTSAYHTLLQSQLSQEVYFGFLYLQILYQVQGKRAHHPRYRFLHHEIERRYQERIEMLFLLLGLLYPSYEMEQARQNYTSGNPHFRALSLEVLNYTLESEWILSITTLLDDISPAQKIRRAHENHWSDPIPDGQWHVHPLMQQDLWLSRLSQWCLTYPKESAMFPIIERMFVLQQSALFAQFGAEVLSTIAEVCHNIRYQDGETIFKANDEASAFYFIARGKVNLYTQSNQLLHTLNTFEGFGEIELLSESKRLATAEANGPCELLCLQHKDFLDLMENHASFAQSLLRSLAQRLSIQMEPTSSSTLN